MEKKRLAGRVTLIGIVVGLSVLAFACHRSPQKPWGVALGQDLKGGTTLRFSLDLQRARTEELLTAQESDRDVVKSTLEVVRSRIDKWGLSELNMVELGNDRFEVSLSSETDIDSIVKIVTQLGNLQFRIEVRPRYDRFEAKKGGEARTRETVWDKSAEEFDEYKKTEVEAWKLARDQAVPYRSKDPRFRVVKRKGTQGNEVGDFAVLEDSPEKQFRFGGPMITNPQVSRDETGSPDVTYQVKTEFQHDFGTWTGTNVGLPMAIVLNDEYFSAPIINSALTDNVQITLGSRGNPAELEAEAKQLATVLQTGSIRVKPTLESRSSVGPTLAGAAVRTGLLSTLVAFLLVLLYMWIYYFRAGLIANAALLLNLVLLVGAMAFLNSVLTLPGIAGIVLTLGMAVDANILVYERIREEQARGRSVGHSVAEGFSRAFTTIVDSNVTTFFVAIALGVFGTGSIKGFAVTLALGLAASMFTAVYVTRTIFEAWIGRGTVDKIHMLGTGKAPEIRWMHLRRWFIPSSIILMVLGIALFLVSKDETVYDIDFTGGMKLQTRFAVPTSVDEAKAALAGGAESVEIPRDFPDADGNLTRKAVVGPYEDAQVLTVETAAGSWLEIAIPRAAGQGDEATLTERERLKALKAYVTLKLGGRLLPTWLRKAPTSYKWVEADGEPMKAFDGKPTMRVALEDPKGVLTADLLKQALTTSRPYYTYESQGAKRVRNPASKVKREVEVKAVTEAGAGVGTSKTFDLWSKAENLEGTVVETDPERLTEEIHEFLGSAAFRKALAPTETSPSAEQVTLADPFPVEDLIGAGVARDLRNDAMLALLLSFVAIVIYVAFRFRSYAMGFSAVLCLVHDVCIALLGVCLVDHMGIIDAKISLGLVAAFLTIVGYSVNDTVVTFDRIRELRGKAPNITVKMIEDAVNQTFSRTIRTTTTVLLTIVVLFAMNLGKRSVLEGLSFTLLVGVTSGAYSTIGVASPLLLFLPWFWARARTYRPRSIVISWAIHKPGSYVLAGAALATTVAAWVISHHVLLAVFYGCLLLPFAVTAGLWLAWGIAFSVGAFVAMSIMLVPWSFHEDPEGAVEADRRSGALPTAATPAPEIASGPKWSAGGPSKRRDEKGPGMQQ